MTPPTLPKLESRVKVLLYSLTILFISGFAVLSLVHELKRRNDFAQKEGLSYLLGFVQNKVVIKDGKITFNDVTPNPAPPPPNLPAAASAATSLPGEAPTPSLPPIDAKNDEDGQLERRYALHCKDFTHDSTLSFFGQTDTEDLLFRLFIGLGFLGGSLGGIIRILALYHRKNIPIIELVLNPILGGVVCALAGLLLIHFVASSTSAQVPFLQSNVLLLQIPVPVFYVSFLASMQPIRTIAGVKSLIMTQFEEFTDKDSGNPTPKNNAPNT